MKITVNEVELTSDQYKMVCFVSGDLNRYSDDLYNQIRRKIENQIVETIYNEYINKNYQDLLRSIDKDVVLNKVLMMVANRVANS